MTDEQRYNELLQKIKDLITAKSRKITQTTQEIERLKERLDETEMQLQSLKNQ